MYKDIIIILPSFLRRYICSLSHTHTRNARACSHAHAHRLTQSSTVKSCLMMTLISIIEVSIKTAHIQVLNRKQHIAVF